MTTRDEYAELIKSAALSAGKTLVMQVLVQRLPFLASAFFNPVAAWLVGKILTIAIKETEFGLFFLYIDLRTNAQGRAFQEAVLHNATAQKTGTPQEKADAEAQLIDSFRRFVRLAN